MLLLLTMIIMPVKLNSTYYFIFRHLSLWFVHNLHSAGTVELQIVYFCFPYLTLTMSLLYIFTEWSSKFCLYKCLIIIFLMFAIVTTYYYWDDMIGLWNIIDFIPLLKFIPWLQCSFPGHWYNFICITVSGTYFADDMS